MSKRSSRSLKISPLYLILLLLAAGGLFLYQGGYLDWLGLPGSSRVTMSAASGDAIKVYFTAPDFADKAPHQGGLDEIVAADIAAAQKSVDVVSFEFDLERITQALIKAHQRGVQVRMVLDDGNLGEEAMAQAVDELKAAGIPIVYDQRQAYMHNKFVIIDRQVLWTGSWNLTDNDTYRNNNNALRFTIPELAENYTTEFEEMFVNKSFGPGSPANTPFPVIQLSDGSRIETYFSPDDNPRAALINQLRQAKQDIVFMAFSFTDEDIARALLEKARAGVRVRGVFEARGAQTEYGQYDVLKKAGLDVLLDGNPRILHHKVFVIDGQVTVTGSYNFSSNAANDNDENLLLITNSNLAKSYLEEFDRVYQAGQKE